MPGDIGLAYLRCPDIVRYLNVRSAVAPSLSPDGLRVAYRTSTTGTPQLWVADARGREAPRQITFGECVTFHQWSPARQLGSLMGSTAAATSEGFYLISPDGTKE